MTVKLVKSPQTETGVKTEVKERTLPSRNVIQTTREKRVLDYITIDTHGRKTVNEVHLLADDD